MQRRVAELGVEAQVQDIRLLRKWSLGDAGTLAQPYSAGDADHQGQSCAGKQAQRKSRRPTRRVRPALCRDKRWRLRRCRKFCGDLSMAGCSGARFGFRQGTFRQCRLGLALGVEARGGGTPGRSFVLGAMTGFLNRHVFCSDARQGCVFGMLFRAYFFGILCRCVLLRCGAFASHACEFCFLVRARNCGGGELGSRGRAALRLGQGTLLGLDAGLRGGFGLPLGGQACGSDAAGLRFPFEAAIGLQLRLGFGGTAQQGGVLGDLLGARLFGRQIGGAAIGCGPFRRKPGEFIFGPGARRRRTGQFGRCAGPGTGLGQSPLLRLDARAQGGFGEALDLRLLQRRLRFGRSTLGLCRIGLTLGFQARGGGTAGFCFLFSATPDFLRRPLLRGHARQGGGFGRLLGAQLLRRALGGEAVGSGAFGGRPCQIFFRCGARSGSGGQLRGGALLRLRRGECLLFRLDALLQRSFGAAFGLRLLGGYGFGGRFGGGASARGLCRRFFRLLALPGGGNGFGRLQAARFGGGTSAFVVAVDRRRRRFVRCRSGVRVCALGSELPAFALGFHQSCQQLAQI
ncbi:MAG: hypothetical protein NDI91_18180 [Sulfuritalea sp.]|nr:hypothetical protein [Sulfuritalea sp.]